MGTTILKLDSDRKLLNADVTSVYPVDLKYVEPRHGVNSIPELELMVKSNSRIVYLKKKELELN